MRTSTSKQRSALRTVRSSLRERERIAFLAVGGTIILPPIIAIAFLVVVLGVGISATRTLVHSEAAVIGGLRWLGVALAVIATLNAAILLVGQVLVFTGVWHRG